MAMSLAWRIHNGCSASVWLVLLIGYIMQIWIDFLINRTRDQRQSRRARMLGNSNVKTGMYRVGLLASVVALVREVDPFASRGLYPVRFPFVLELNLSVMIVMDTGMIIFAAIILSHSTLNKVNAWAQRAKRAGYALSACTFVLANIMWLLEDLTESAFWGYGLFCFVVALFYLIEIVIWDMATLKVLPYFASMRSAQRTSSGTSGQDVLDVSMNAATRTRAGSVDMQLALVMSNLWYFQAFCNVVILCLVPLLVLEGSRSLEDDFVIQLDGEGFQPIRAGMLWGQTCVCAATLWFTWRPWSRRLSLSTTSRGSRERSRNSRSGSRSRGSKQRGSHQRQRSTWLGGQRMPTFNYGPETPLQSRQASVVGNGTSSSELVALAQTSSDQPRVQSADQAGSGGQPKAIALLEDVPEASQSYQSRVTEVTVTRLGSADAVDVEDFVSTNRLPSRAADSVLYAAAQGRTAVQQIRAQPLEEEANEDSSNSQDVARDQQL